MSDLNNPFQGVRLQPQGIRDVAYQALRDAILTLQLRPGERLIEERLAAQLGVSRTPMREAIRKLEQEGLVVRLPSGGVAVSGLDPAELADLYAIRIALEELAARQAASRISAAEVAHLQEINDQVVRRHDPSDPRRTLAAGKAFHSVIWAASHNARLAEMLESLMSRINRYRIYSVVWRVQAAVAEHQAVIDALRAGDPDQAAAVMRRHIETERDLTLSKLAAEAES